MRIAVFGVLSTLVVLSSNNFVYAALTAGSQLSQVIGAGVLSTSIRDGSGAVVASPSFSMNSAAVSTNAQTVTGTFGTTSQRITVDNPGGANNGWTLTLAGTSGGSTVWTNGSATYPFNGNSTTGQLTVNPSIAALTPVTGTSTGITLGSQAAFSAATPVNLMTASGGSDDIWNGYITGVGMSQVIPASQVPGTYTLDLTQTVAAT